MDGTLTNSEPLWAEATFYLSELLGKRLTPTQRLATVGATFDTTLGICADNAGVTLQSGDSQRYRELMFAYVKRLFASNLEVFPGIASLLKELEADGIPMMDMYREAARRVGADPAKCLVFEDSATGMRAAVDAGCAVIGLPEDNRVEVPAGVTEVSLLRSSRHLEGATASDVYGWFRKISTRQ